MGFGGVEVFAPLRGLRGAWAFLLDFVNSVPDKPAAPAGRVLGLFL